MKFDVRQEVIQWLMTKDEFATAALELVSAGVTRALTLQEMRDLVHCCFGAGQISMQRQLNSVHALSQHQGTCQ